MRQHWMTLNCVTGPDQRSVLLNTFRRRPAIAYVTETSLFSLCNKMHACPYFSRIQNLYFKFPGQAESTFRPPQSSQVYLQAETQFRTCSWLKGCLQIWQTTNFQWSRGVGLSFSNHILRSQRSSDCACNHPKCGNDCCISTCQGEMKDCPDGQNSVFSNLQCSRHCLGWSEFSWVSWQPFWQWPCVRASTDYFKMKIWEVLRMFWNARA